MLGMKSKKVIYLFFVVFTIILFTGCDGKQDTSFKLDSTKYTDVLGVINEVRTVNKNGLFSLEKDGKKISNDYLYITTRITTIEGEKKPYFIGFKQDKTYSIIQIDGTEIALEREYTEFVNEDLGDMILAKTKDNKKTLISFTKGEIEVYFDEISPKNIYNHGELSYMYIAYNGPYGDRTFSLINEEGVVIIKDVKGIESYTVSETYDGTVSSYFSVKITDSYRLANSDGAYINSIVYSEIRVMNQVIKCTKKSFEGFDYYNYDYKSISQSATDNLLYVYGNDKFIIFNNPNLSIYVLEKFSGEKINYDFLIVESYNVIKFHKDNKVGYLDLSGNELYSINNPGSLSLVGYRSLHNVSHYLFKEDNKLIYTNGNNSEIKTITNNNNYSYSIQNSYVAGTFIIYATINGESKQAILSFRFGDISDLSDLEFYSNVTVESYNDIEYAILKDQENSKVYLQELVTGERLEIGKNLNSENFNNIHLNTSTISSYITKYEEYNTIKGIIVSLSYQDYREHYVIYQNELYNPDKTSNLKFHYLEEEGIYHPQGFNIIYGYQNNETNVYSFVEDNGEYTLQKVFTSTFDITSVIYDEDVNIFYVIKNSFNNKYGLADKLGNILIQPQFDQISQINKGNVVVQRDIYYGVIKLNKDNVYKYIADIKYLEIKFLGDGYFISKDRNSSYLLHNANGDIENEEILSYKNLSYLKIEDDKYTSYPAYKLNFGSYVRIFYSTEENKITFPPIYW